MNLYIIRHGESTWNVQNRIQGNSDPGLSKLGRAQAGLLAKRFKNIKVDKIYSSPLSRSLETARIIARGCRGMATAAINRAPTVIRRDGLKEIGLGEWENRTPEEINRLYSNKYQEWLKKGPTKVRIPAAEGIGHFRKRVDEAFKDIIRGNKTKGNIIVVTHGGVISAFLARLLNADFDRIILSLHLPNTSVTFVSFEQGRGCLIHIADTLHLSRGQAKGVWPAE